MPDCGNLQLMTRLVERYGFDSTDPVTDVINMAMHEVESQEDWTFLEKFDVTTVTAGNNMVTVPSDCVKVMTVRNVSTSQSMEYMAWRKFARKITVRTEVGNPTIYTLISSNYMQVWRVPQLDTSFEILYQATPPDLASVGDTPMTAGVVWPSWMQPCIVYRAASILLMMENEEQRADTAQQQYIGSLMTAKAKNSERELGDVETVEDVMNYGS